MRLQDQVALITGAGRGIGRAIALAYAREGARLALAARTLDELEETARQAEALGVPTSVIPIDVTEQAQVEEMVKRTIERFSTLDILVNNAGLAGPVGPLQDNDVAHWTRTIQVNIIGVFLCCRAVLPVMISRDRGKIINLYGGRGRHLSSYGASKVAVADITATLALELEGKNIQVNGLNPGSIGGGGASMERVAELAVLLAGETSDGLTGRVIQAETEDFSTLPQRIPSIMASDAGTLKLLGSV